MHAGTCAEAVLAGKRAQTDGSCTRPRHHLLLFELLDGGLQLLQLRHVARLQRRHLFYPLLLHAVDARRQLVQLRLDSLLLPAAGVCV